MKLRPFAWFLTLGCVWALPSYAWQAAADGRPTAALRSVDLESLKIQWFNKDEEELPSWIDAHFDVGALGQVTGRLVETELSADGTDDDGDPLGFESNVFDTSDGSLKDVSLGPDRFSFTILYPGQDGGQVQYAGRRSATVSGEWLISAAARSPKGDSAGHNRFPLTSEEKKEGALEIYTNPDEQSGRDTQSL